MHGSVTMEAQRSLRRLLAVLAAASLLVTGLVATGGASPAQAAAAGPKDTIAVLFSYTWNQIAKECESTLGPAGYGYVQTSPPQEHVKGSQWWTYYQPVSYKLETRMGTEAEFTSMVQRCKAAGVGVIVDAVINHMSGKSEGGTGWAGTPFQHYDYPGIYSSSDFHNCRKDITNYQDRYDVQNCNLVNLSDLDTSSDHVQQTIANYLNRFVDMGVAGFRIDAVKHIAAQDMAGIWNRVRKKDSLYVVQEVIRANEPVQPEEYISIGDVHEFGFARKLKEAFGGSRIDWLISGAGIGGSWDGFLKQDDAAVFVDNHDTERNNETLSYKDGKSYDLAQAFTLAWPYGSPSVHSGYAFSDKDAGPALDGQGRVIDPAPGQNGWTFKHAQNDIQNMVGFRVATYGTAVANKWSSADGSAMSFSRGDRGFIALNNGSGQVQREFTTSLPDGKYYNVITAKRTGGTWSGDTVTVAGGKFTATVSAKTALALHAGAKVESCVDVSAPSTPAAVSAKVDGGSLAVSWQASSDDCGVSGYDVVRTGGSGGAVTKTVTGTTLTDKTFSAATAYTYTVTARDASGKSSAASAPATVTTPEAPVVTGTSVYYKAPSGWSKAYMHYRSGTGAWTTAPGTEMAPVAGLAGWFSATVDAADGAALTAAFNNGGGTWDNNGDKNYAIPAGPEWSVSEGKVVAGTPDKPVVTGSSVYYQAPAGWTKAYLHYRVGTAAWTTAPGVEMTPVEGIPGWFKASIEAPAGTATTAAFNNGAGAWDNNGGNNYAIPTGPAWSVSGGSVNAGAPQKPVAPKPLAGKLDLFYKTGPGWSTANAHYQVGAGAWTAAPGIAMAAVSSCVSGNGWYRLTIDSGTAANVTVAFNNGAGAWDNNGGKNYTFTTDVAAVSAGKVTTADPCGVIVPEPAIPAMPTAVAVKPLGSTSIQATWTAVPDATSYSISYGLDGQGEPLFVKVSSGTELTAPGLLPGKRYWFKVRAENAAGASAYSPAAFATTEAEIEPTVEPTATATVEPTAPPTSEPGDRVGTDHSVGLYKTNPSAQVGKSKAITVDGDASEWTADMIIAQGVANDDPRIFRGSHEGPVYDPYALYGSWDDDNLYLMWQFTNVTDVVDPAQGYPISDNGKPYQGDIPQAIALDVNNRGSNGMVTADEKGVWGMRYSFANNEADHLLMFSSKPKVGQPSIFSLNSDDEFDYEPENVSAFKDAGVSFAYGDGFVGSTVMGIKKNGYEGYVPADLKDAANFTDLLTKGHDKAQDTTYEMKIPLASLGIDRGYLEGNGVGVMLVSTFGESAIGSLPYDPTTLDHALDPYTADESTSAEKEDVDTFTAKFASVGSVGTSSVLPATPKSVTAAPVGTTSLKASWAAVAGATSYTVTYAAESQGQPVFVKVASGTQFTATGLAPGTRYWFKVRAETTAGASPYSAAVFAATDTEVEPTTEPTETPTIDPTVEPTVDPTPEPTVDPTPEPTVDPTPEPTVDPTPIPTPTVDPTPGPGTEPGGSVAGATQGSPLGGDPREDSIYFMMTARWNDGDSSNNMGGSQHVKSGNAANNDPMYRGDFQGVIDKLDYIKGIGFSAIWITPVVTNRSDYDFHGYHGWDFQRIDPRLESEGATYQELIDAAHAKGIKIYQDVVYNHTSRWGEKNLFVPTVFGTRDAQWDWYYDEPVEGKAYNPAETDADGSTYNGDLWSTTQPADQKCKNWGVQSGFSAEGYKVYNCQWPNATSGMFPADTFHQCWIGNWEGKDAQDCWIHEDLADLNTESAKVQDYLIDTYNKYIDMGVDGFRVDTAVHIPRVMWNRHFLPALQEHAVATHGDKGKDFYVFGEVAQFVHDKWNRGSVNHSAPFYTWKERRSYSIDDVVAAAEQFQYENLMGPAGQPTSANHKLDGNNYHKPDHSASSGMSIIDMRMHMNFDNASNAFHSGMDSDDATNDATYNAVYVDSHDYGPGKSQVRFDGGTDAWAENLSLMWSFRGVPVLFYGSEIEFQAGKPIDCGPTCPLATTGRAYFGDHLAGTVTAGDFGTVTSASGAVAETLQKPLVKHLQTLNQVRRAVPALQKGQYSTDGVSGNMAFKRRFTEGSVDSFVLVAVSEGASFSGIPNGTYVDAVTGDSKTVSNGSLTIPLSGKGNMRAYVLSLPGNPAPGKVGNGSPFLK